MKTGVAVALFAVLSTQAGLPAISLVERLATCQDSWRDWKDDPARMQAMAGVFRKGFADQARDGSFAPKGKLLVVGLPVLQVYPESVGMGVGFSVVLDATFETARQHVEKALGRALTDCETGDGMRTCGLEIARERTITLMAGEQDMPRRTLLGCYYLYEK
jgi:hypothetical protein